MYDKWITSCDGRFWEFKIELKDSFRWDLWNGARLTHSLTSITILNEQRSLFQSKSSFSLLGLRYHRHPIHHRRSYWFFYVYIIRNEMNEFCFYAGIQHQTCWYGWQKLISWQKLVLVLCQVLSTLVHVSFDKFPTLVPFISIKCISLVKLASCNSSSVISGSSQSNLFCKLGFLFDRSFPKKKPLNIGEFILIFLAW